MTKIETEEANEWARRIWDTNAAFWNQHMGEGNDFVHYLIWPATEGLMELKVRRRSLGYRLWEWFCLAEVVRDGCKSHRL